MKIARQNSCSSRSPRLGASRELGFPRVKNLALLVAAACSAFGGVAEAAEDAAVSKKRGTQQVSFDLDMLKERGLDPKLAEYFREAPRFSGGQHLVTLFLNGAKRGMLDARFDDQGGLCFNRELIEKAGLVLPPPSFLIGVDAAVAVRSDAVIINSAATDCYDFKAMFAQTEVELRPGRAEVALVVPAAALRASEVDFSGYGTGGTAGLFNYHVISLSNQSRGASHDYLSANTEFGFNSHGWMVRSRQSYTEQDGNSKSQSLYTYAQRTLVEHKSILQIGQINTASSVVGGAALTGVQIVPETALQRQLQSGARIEGIAQSQARVEVHQVGALIYSTVVPAGPFTLENISLLNGSADLIVSVIEADGSKRSFTVAAASLGKIPNAAPGYSFAMGKVRRFAGSSNDDSRDPFVVTGSGGWVLDERHQLSAGAMLASGYQSTALSLDSAPVAGTYINMRVALSSAAAESVRGAQLSMSANTQMSEKLSVGFAMSKQTDGYRDLLETTYARNADFDSRALTQYNASLNWNDATLGGLSISYGHANAYNGAASQRFTASWGKTFQRATISANIERNISRDQRGSDNSFYINVSLPLGKRSVRSYLNNSGGKSRLGTSVSEQVNDYVNYRVSTEHHSASNDTDVSGNLALLPRYAQLNLGYARSGSGSTSYVGEMRGGVALHDAGVTLSPYPIRDTFGIIQVGDVAGVRINTPGGPVWTDAWGRAVMPYLPAYSKNKVEVATKSLPRNVDIKNGFKLVGAGRGSVQHLDFGIVKVRRVLMQAADMAGQPLAKGASVMSHDNQFLTTVVDDGKLFLSNGQLDGGVKVSLADGTQCALDFSLPEKPDVNLYFETANAVCRPVGVVPKI